MTVLGNTYYGTWTDNSSYYSDPYYAYKSYESDKWDWGHVRVNPEIDGTLHEELIKRIAEVLDKSDKVPKQTEERRDKMISRKVFNEALAEAGVSKGVRRKVENLKDNDFEYLLATLLAKAFDPGMLAVFEPDVQKVKVVEEA